MSAPGLMWQACDHGGPPFLAGRRTRVLVLCAAASYGQIGLLGRFLGPGEDSCWKLGPLYRVVQGNIPNTPLVLDKVRYGGAPYIYAKYQTSHYGSSGSHSP